MTKLPIGLLINDLHVGKDTIKEFALNWNEAIDICVSKNIPVIYLGGDLFQSRASQNLPILLAVKSAIQKAHSNNIMVIAANGNHDKESGESIEGYCDVYSGYEGYRVIPIYETFNHGNVAFHVMAYFPENGSFEDKLKTIEVDKSKNNLIYIHQGIRGVLQNVDPAHELDPKIFKDFDKVLVGHYHNRTSVKPNIEYIGSSRQHNFGEDEDKGYTLIYNDGTTEFVKNKVNIRFETLTESFSDINKDKLSVDVKLLLKQNYKVRLKLICKDTEVSSVVKQDFSEMGISKVEIISNVSEKTIESTNAFERYDKEGIKKSYIEFSKLEGIEDVNKGLEYIDSISE